MRIKKTQQMSVLEYYCDLCSAKKMLIDDEPKRVGPPGWYNRAPEVVCSGDTDPKDHCKHVCSDCVKNITTAMQVGVISRSSS